MGHALGAAPLEERDERREAKRASQGFFVACCYTPRKPMPEGMQTLGLALPRYKTLVRPPGFESDTDSDCGNFKSGLFKTVHFPPLGNEAVLHTWVEEGDEWVAARRSDDVDWANLSEKITSVMRIADIKAFVTLPTTCVSGLTAHERARARRHRRSRKDSVDSIHADAVVFAPSPSEGSSKGDLPIRSQSQRIPRWSPKDLENWNPEHIKAITVELFAVHDVENKGWLSWRDNEVMAFVSDFFHLHGCAQPKLPVVVFSTAYNQVKIDSIPSHRDIDGLDLAETCDFARRVYDFILNGLSGEVREQRRLSTSILLNSGEALQPGQPPSLAGASPVTV